MAKQSNGILDGYRGTIGTVVGYQWRGRWCLRSRPRHVHNPRTAAQQEHRMVFRDMVRVAGRMKQALRLGLRADAMREGLTECNLFVKINKGCFGPQGADYGAMEVSRGPVAPVGFTDVTVDEDNVLHARFERNPLHLHANGDDEVYVYAFCPSRQEGLLSAPVLRRHRELRMALPDEWEGVGVVFYAFVRDYRQESSATLHLDPDGAAGQPDHAAVEPDAERIPSPRRRQAEAATAAQTVPTMPTIDTETIRNQRLVLRE